MELFEKLKNKNPDDKLFSLYIQRCEEFIKYGVPDKWDGVEVLDSK